MTRKRSKGLEIKLGSFEKAHKLEKVSKGSSNTLHGFASAQKLSKKLIDNSTLELSEDICDIGVLAFNLLDGIVDDSGVEQSVANFSVAQS